MNVFKALADSTRRDIVIEASRQAVKISDLATTRNISRPAISKHMRSLLDAELVTVTNSGRERHYSTNTAALQPVIDFLTAIRDDSDQEVDVPLPVSAESLAALDLEVRHTAKDLTRQHQPSTHQTTKEQDSA